MRTGVVFVQNAALRELQELLHLQSPFMEAITAPLFLVRPIGEEAIPSAHRFRVLIGEKDFWNGGYGTEVTQLMVAYGFEVLNMHKVWLGVTSDNVGAVRCYDKVGFVKEGVLRAETYRNSRYYDAVRMSILRHEYDQLRDKWAIADKLQTQFPR